MDIKEELRVCRKVLTACGYDPKIRELETEDMELLAFTCDSIGGGYEARQPEFTIGFAKGAIQGGPICFDVMQIFCMIDTAVPIERLSQIQLFCADFNKNMQVGAFEVDYERGAVFFKCGQVIDAEITEEQLSRLTDHCFMLILFYFSLTYGIFTGMSCGAVSYSEAEALLESKAVQMSEAISSMTK